MAKSTKPKKPRPGTKIDVTDKGEIVGCGYYAEPPKEVLRELARKCAIRNFLSLNWPFGLLYRNRRFASHEGFSPKEQAEKAGLDVMEALPRDLPYGLGITGTLNPEMGGLLASQNRGWKLERELSIGELELAFGDGLNRNFRLGQKFEESNYLMLPGSQRGEETRRYLDQVNGSYKHLLTDALKIAGSLFNIKEPSENNLKKFLLGYWEENHLRRLKNTNDETPESCRDKGEKSHRPRGRGWSIFACPGPRPV